MTDTSLLTTINEALAVRSWRESEQAVKSVVANALQSMDPSVRLKDTQYFNHSFVPDFVLSWSEGDSRDLFLRLELDPDVLADDAAALSGIHPIMFGLDSLPIATTESERLAAVTETTLVTDSLAVSTLGASRTNSFGGVLPPALLKGGRGVLTGDEAAEMASVTSLAFDAAEQHRPDPISAATPIVESHLSPMQSTALLNFMRVVWEATGGASESFPIGTSLAGLDYDAFRFLLQDGPPDDVLFWRKVGGQLSFSTLVELGIRSAPNLHVFLATNLDRVKAKYLMVKPEQSRLGDPDVTWEIRGSALVLRGTDFHAMFAQKGSDIPEEPDTVSLRGVEAFSRRAGSRNVESVTLSNGSVVASVDSIEHANVVDDENLRLLSNNPNNLVVGVGLAINAKRLDLRLDHLTGHGASGRTEFTLKELLDEALPVLWGLDERDRSALASMNEVFATVTEEPNLFSTDLGRRSEEE